MKKSMKVGLITTVAVLHAGAVFAAGAGEGIETGFTEVGTDLNTLLGGAGGFIILVISILFGAIMLAIGRGWGPAVTAFGTAMVLSYGVTALTGIAGVSATTDVLLSSQVASPLLESGALVESTL